MIQKNSPEGQFLTIIWRSMMSHAPAVSEQYKWILTGTAAILGVVVGNLKSIEEVVGAPFFSISLCSLVGSLFMAAVAYMLSMSSSFKYDAAVKFEEKLHS